MELNLINNKFHGEINLEELKNFRFKNGKRFPESYIKFVKKYGYGRTCDLFLIYVPYGNHNDSFLIRKDEIISTYKDVLEDENELWFDLEPDLNYEDLKNLIPFGISENGYYLFWDTETNNKNEMDIYITDFRGLGFTKVAKDLFEFLDLIISKSHFKKVLPFSTEPLKPTFEPLEFK